MDLIVNVAMSSIKDSYCMKDSLPLWKNCLDHSDMKWFPASGTKAFELPSMDLKVSRILVVPFPR